MAVVWTSWCNFHVLWRQCPKWRISNRRFIFPLYCGICHLRSEKIQNSPAWIGFKSLLFWNLLSAMIDWRFFTNVNKFLKMWFERQCGDAIKILEGLLNQQTGTCHEPKTTPSFGRTACEIMVSLETWSQVYKQMACYNVSSHLSVEQVLGYNSAEHFLFNRHQVLLWENSIHTGLVT